VASTRCSGLIPLTQKAGGIATAKGKVLQGKIGRREKEKSLFDMWRERRQRAMKESLSGGEKNSFTKQGELRWRKEIPRKNGRIATGPEGFEKLQKGEHRQRSLWKAPQQTENGRE